MKRPVNLGTPVPVEVAAVEQELRSLWKAASDKEGENAFIRTCSSNLVVLARDLREAESISLILARVSEWHPTRCLIVCRKLENQAAGHSPAHLLHDTPSSVRRE